MKNLRDTLAKWLPLHLIQEDNPGTAEPENVEEIVLDLEKSISTQDASTAVIWDPNTLTELIGDEPTMQRNLLEMFLNNGQKQVAEILSHSFPHNASAQAEVAHTLKSASNTVGALALGQLCQRIETAGREDNLTECGQLVACLEFTINAASAVIRNKLDL